MVDRDDTEEGQIDTGRYVGQQVRKYRRIRGLTQQVLADRIGEHRTLITRCETGERPIDSRVVLYKLAEALSVSIGDLTGHQEDKVSPATIAFHAAVPRIEGALMSAGVVDESDEPRPIQLLTTEADQSLTTFMACDYTTLGRVLPNLLTDLYRLTSGPEADSAWRALTAATFSTAISTKKLGYTSLAWIASRACAEAAATCGEPAGLAAAEYMLAQTLLAMPGVASASLAHSAGSAERLHRELAETTEGLEMYGMLHLHAALTTAATGGDPSDHLNEAAETATRTGESPGQAFALAFGGQNVDIWRMSVALEQRDGGRAIEVARTIDPASIPSVDRQARFFVELGRAHALERDYTQCLHALLRAEHVAPQEVRSMNVVRELVGAMVRKARRDVLNGELGKLAERVSAL